MNNSALIITSISTPENKILQDYAQKAFDRQMQYIVVGDEASPDNFNIKGCEFLSLKTQSSLGFELSKLLPKRHYARKNLGYLKAMKDGVDIIIETDDDNYAKEDFWNERKKIIPANLYEDRGWLNVYKLFTESNIWPRGFSIEHINNIPENSSIDKNCNCLIQQGLADENPDVDAIYRMILPLPFNFNTGKNVALGKNTWCPFNSQNTTWFKEVFLLMYLPSYCSFRMTDIWRSFVAQRICWENDFNILFHNATVWQERNDHNLLKDFNDEIPGYSNNNYIIKELEALNLKKGVEYIPDNLLSCYNLYTKMNLVDKKEIDLIKSWIKDVNALM